VPLVAVALLAQSISVSAAVAPRVEQFRYRFDNPSSFGTAALVPHFFEQRYDAVPVWFSAEARYRLGGSAAATSAAISLRGRTHGSDIDTFFQPSGDVATSGTNGDVMLRSLELRQRIAVGATRGWLWALTMGYRHDRADFLPDDRIVTHTTPPSVVRTFITDRETAISQAMTFGVEATRERALNDRWHVTIGAGVQPLVRGRLLVQLPDKYPGVDLIFTALSAGATARVSVERRAHGWRAGVAVSGEGAWAYRPSSAYALRGVSIAVFAGPGGR